MPRKGFLQYRPALGAGLLMGLLASCAAPPEFTLRPKEVTAWPAAESSPRIELELAYSGTQDVTRHRGFFASILPFLFGADSQDLVSPYGICFKNDVLWVTDPGRSCVHRISFKTGEHLICSAPEGKTLVTPIAVVGLPNGRIWVSDSSTGWISEFNEAGDWLRAIGGPQEIERPTGMYCDKSLDRVLVVDTTACQILVYDYEGKLLEKHGERGDALGQFNYPTHLAVSRKGTILVVDSLNYRVQAFTPDFKALGAFGVVGRGPGNFASPKGIALDTQDHVYVVDSLFENVQIFDLNGRLLLAFSSHGGELGNTSLPSGIFIDEKDRIYLSDTGNARVQIYQFHRGQE